MVFAAEISELTDSLLAIIFPTAESLKWEFDVSGECTYCDDITDNGYVCQFFMKGCSETVCKVFLILIFVNCPGID